MRIQVRYYNVLADYAGTRRASCQVPAGTTLRGLIAHLVATNPQLFGRVVLHDGALSPHVRVFLNEKLVTEDDIERPLTEGDEVLLFPAVGGGL